MPEERLRVRHHLRDPSLRDLTVPLDAAVEGAVVAQPHRHDVRGWDGQAVTRFTRKKKRPSRYPFLCKNTHWNFHLPVHFHGLERGLLVEVHHLVLFYARVIVVAAQLRSVEGL